MCRGEGRPDAWAAPRPWRAGWTKNNGRGSVGGPPDRFAAPASPRRLRPPSGGRQLAAAAAIPPGGHDHNIGSRTSPGTPHATLRLLTAINRSRGGAGGAGGAAKVARSPTAADNYDINDNDGRGHHDEVVGCLLAGTGIKDRRTESGHPSDNFEGTPRQAAVLDQAMIALLADLQAKGLAD